MTTPTSAAEVRNLDFLDLVPEKDRARFDL
jgi:hypothetical protein